MIGALVVKLFGWLSQRGTDEKKKRQYVFAGFLILLPFFVTPIESRTPAPNWIRQVTDSVIIAGTPETVWNNIIRMDTIPESEQRPSFYHTMGIPRPIRATLSKEDVGGIRQGEFEFGLMFYETITVWGRVRQLESHSREAPQVPNCSNSRPKTSSSSPRSSCASPCSSCRPREVESQSSGGGCGIALWKKAWQFCDPAG